MQKSKNDNGPENEIRKSKRILQSIKKLDEDSWIEFCDEKYYIPKIIDENWKSIVTIIPDK